MKTILILLLIVAGTMRVSAQDMYARLEKNRHKMKTDVTTDVVAGETNIYQWEFWSAEESGTAKDCPKSMEILYGKEVGSLLSLMNSRFICRERVDAGDPSLRTVVRKPAIYNAVKNIEKYYKQKNKKNDYTMTDRETFTHVVRVALASVDTENTADFEQALQDTRKSMEKQIACFCRVKLKNIYE